MRPAGLLCILLAVGATIEASPLAEGVAHAQARAPRKRGKDREREKREQEKKAEEAKAAEDAEKKKADEADAAKDKTPEPEPAKPVFDDQVEADKAVYFQGDLAFTRSDLAAIVDDTGFDRTVANGVLYGLSGGLRLKDLRFGLRWRVYDTTEFALWTFAVSAGIGLKYRPLQPVFSAHLGYAFDQKMEPPLFRQALPLGNVLPPDVDVKGLILGVDANASYWVTKFFRLGAFIGVDLLVLSREQSELPRSTLGTAPELINHPLYTESGFGLGLNVSLGLRVAFDIGIQ